MQKQLLGYKFNLFERALLALSNFTWKDSVLNLSYSSPCLSQYFSSQSIAHKNLVEVECENATPYFNTCLSTEPLCAFENKQVFFHNAKKYLYKGEFILLSYCAPKFLAMLFNAFAKDAQGRPLKKFYTKKELHTMLALEGFDYINSYVCYGFIAVCTAWRKF